MILKINSGWVIKRNKVIELTPLENKLLQVLCNNELNSFEEMFSYVYPKKDFYFEPDPYTSIRMIKMRLKRKLKLDIKSIREKGYRLKDTILINY